MVQTVDGEAFLAYARAETAKSDETHQTLKHWTMTIVHRAMVELYGENYSIRCMECAMGVQRVLAKYDLDGPIVMGALCLPQITDNPAALGWAGFWGKDHHFWAMSTKHEVIDLSMSQNHLHPATTALAPKQPPAVWFSVMKPWVNTVLHLPAVMAGGAHSETDQELMDEYLRRIDQIEEGMRKNKRLRPQDVKFSAAPFVTAASDFNYWAAVGDPWCSVAHIFQDMPRPNWVEARISELNSGSLESCLPMPEATKIIRERPRSDE